MSESISIFAADCSNSLRALLMEQILSVSRTSRVACLIVKTVLYLPHVQLRLYRLITVSLQSQYKSLMCSAIGQSIGLCACSARSDPVL